MPPIESHVETRCPFTVWGLIVGSLLSLFVGVAAPYGFIVVRGSWFGSNASTPGAIFLFFVFTFFINTLIGVIRRPLALGRGDLVLVYAMLVMAITVPTQNFLVFIIPTICVPYYSASIENDWATLIHPYIPEWIAPQDSDVIKNLYEGLPAGQTIPWASWIVPLGAWFSLFVALSLMMIFMSVILHRQWSANERLPYPMIQLPRQMIEEGDEPLRHIKPFFRNPVMWAGFAVPFSLFGLTGLHHYFPTVPDYRFFHGGIELFEGVTSLPMAVSFAWIGFFYFVDRSIIFSIWFFYVAGKLEQGVFNTLGVSSREVLSQMEYRQTADLSHQATGAVVAFVLIGLWTARPHLAAVWRKAWGSDSEIDDSEEVVPYRVALFGWMACLVFIAFWLWLSGVPVVALPLFIGMVLVYYIMITRVVTAGGIPTTRPPIVAPYVVISGLGASVLGNKGLVAMGFAMGWQSEMRLFPMVACTNALKLAEIVRGPKGRLFWGMLLALVCSLAAGTWLLLTLGYEHGGINLAGPFLGNGDVWHFLNPQLNNPSEVNVRGWVFTGIGAAVEGFLMWAQHRWYWWPLHPLGFAIAVGFITAHIWFSALLAWAVKAWILKYGGNRLFSGLKPFFLGFIVGEATSAGFWMCVDAITGATDNGITAM